jgi:hypothetical protein
MQFTIPPDVWCMVLHCTCGPMEIVSLIFSYNAWHTAIAAAAVKNRTAYQTTKEFFYRMNE